MSQIQLFIWGLENVYSMTLKQILAVSFLCYFQGGHQQETGATGKT